MKRIVASLVGLGLMGGLIVSAPSASSAPVQPADDWVPSQIQETKIPLNWSRATLEDQVTLDSMGRRPIVDGEKRVWILACEREIQLDCVESVGLVDENGVYSPGSFAAGRTHDVYRSDGVKPYAEHVTLWRLPGLEIEGRQPLVVLAIGMGGNERHDFKGMNMMTTLEGIPYRQSSPSDPYGCRGSDQGACTAPPVFPEGTVMRVVLRTSWLAPSLITVRGEDVVSQVDDLGTGARRITITGSPTLLQSQGGMQEVISGRPQWVYSSFDFGMVDPRLSSTPGGTCAVDDPILISNNAQGADIPTWSSSEGRLDLRVVSPHYWSDGSTEWRGFYETAISSRVARCMWGIDPRMTSYLSLEVYDEDGQEKAATTAIGLRGGYVSIRAYDFTFSRNTISAQVNVKAGQRCFTKGVEMTGLTCTKKGKRLVWVKRKR